jgi:hypothetical protein
MSRIEKVTEAMLAGSVTEAALLRLTKRQLVDLLIWTGYGIGIYDVEAKE